MIIIQDGTTAGTMTATATTRSGTRTVRGTTARARVGETATSTKTGQMTHSELAISKVIRAGLSVGAAATQATTAWCHMETIKVSSLNSLPSMVELTSVLHFVNFQAEGGNRRY